MKMNDKTNKAEVKNDKTNKAEVKNDKTNKQGKDAIAMKVTQQEKAIEEKIVYQGQAYLFNPEKDSFEFIKENNDIFKGDAETGLKIHKALLAQSKLAMFNDSTSVEKIAEFLKYDVSQLTPMRYEGKLKISDSKGEQVYKFIMSQGEKLKGRLVKLDKSLEINRNRLEREKTEYRKRATRLHSKKNDTFTLLKTILPIEEYLKLKGVETTDKVETKVETTDKAETSNPDNKVQITFENLVDCANRGRSRRNRYSLMLQLVKVSSYPVSLFEMFKAFQTCASDNLYSYKSNQVDAIENMMKEIGLPLEKIKFDCKLIKGKYTNTVTNEIIN